MPGEVGVMLVVGETPPTPHTAATTTNHGTVISGEGKNPVAMATTATLPRQPTMKRKGNV